MKIKDLISKLFQEKHYFWMGGGQTAYLVEHLWTDTLLVLAMSLAAWNALKTI
jgi:hypothetical protein